MFLSLDYVYLPSRDVAADVTYFTTVLGARPVFTIEAMGTRVAAVAVTEAPPMLVIAGHLEGERPILVYRVDALEPSTHDLEARGWSAQHSLEIPQGPVRTFVAPGGQRLAIYELTRPGVIESFEGRRDF